jgi:hypothetical protein
MPGTPTVVTHETVSGLREPAPRPHDAVTAHWSDVRLLASAFVADIVCEMQGVGGQQLTSVGSMLSLLLLLAAQQRVCPAWAYAQPESKETPRHVDSSDDDSRKDDKPEPLAITAALPDLIVARVGVEGQLRSASLAEAGWCTAPGAGKHSDSPPPPPPMPPDPLWWQSLQSMEPPPPIGSVLPIVPVSRVNPARLTAILASGPPLS